MNESKLRLKHYFNGLFGDEVMNLFNKIERYFSNLQGWTRKDINLTEAIYFLAWLVQNELLSSGVSKLSGADVEKLTNMLLIRQYQLVVTRNLEEQPPSDDLNQLISNFNSRLAEYKALWAGVVSKETSLKSLNLLVFEMIQNKNITSGYFEHDLKFSDNLTSFMLYLNSALLRNIDSIGGLIEKEVKLESLEKSSFEDKIVRHSAIVAEWLVLQYSREIGVPHNQNPVFFYCFTYYLCLNWYVANCPNTKEEFKKNFKELLTNTIRNTLDPKIDLLGFVDDFFRQYKIFLPVIQSYINSAIDLRNESRPPSVRIPVPDSTGVNQIVLDTWYLADPANIKLAHISIAVLMPTVFKIMSDYEDLFDHGELRLFSFS